MSSLAGNIKNRAKLASDVSVRQGGYMGDNDGALDLFSSAAKIRE